MRNRSRNGLLASCGWPNGFLVPCKREGGVASGVGALLT